MIERYNGKSCIAEQNCSDKMKSSWLKVKLISMNRKDCKQWEGESWDLREESWELQLNGEIEKSNKDA